MDYCMHDIYVQRMECKKCMRNIKEEYMELVQDLGVIHKIHYLWEYLIYLVNGLLNYSVLDARKYMIVLNSSRKLIVLSLEPPFLNCS